MLATRTALEAELNECRKRGDWNRAYDLLTPLILDDTHPDHGWARMELANTQFWQSPKNVRGALYHVDAAIARLQTDIQALAKALTLGFWCASYADDGPRLRSYSAHARIVVGKNDPASLKWHGRLIHWIGLQFMAAGKAREAKECFCMAAEFYGSHIGPHGPGDQRCQRRIALTALGEVELMMGQVADARAHLREARDITDATATGDVAYLTGLLALSDENFEEAVQHLILAMRQATQVRDHTAILRISHPLARALDALGQFDTKRLVFQEIIEQAAEAGLDRVLLRLQRLVNRR